VRQQAREVRTWFCFSAALVAAAIADVLVEFASNRGAFGRGSFTDHSNQDVLPALCGGLLVAMVYVAMRTRRMLKRRLAVPFAIGALLPYVFGLQIALLYAMETLEQCVVAGHALGGTLWLGGPPIASLAVHAAACVLVTFLLARSTRALSHKAVRIVAFVVAAIGVAPRVRALAYVRVARRAGIHRRALLLGPTGKRAPPQLAA
jgi:hypothetical protein